MKKIRKLIDQLSVLSDEMNLQILSLLKLHGNLYVCNLEEVLGCPQSSLSRHLSSLRKADLIDSTKEGKFRLYHLIQTDHYIGMIIEEAIKALGYDEKTPVSKEKIEKIYTNCKRRNCDQNDR